jgi:hypothetical protein
MMTEEEIYRKAKKKVKEKKAFYIHFGIYLVGIAMLFTINYMTYEPFQWWMLAALGWGMAIVGQYIATFGMPFIHEDDDWEEKELEKEIEKLERRNKVLKNNSKGITVPDDELELKEFKKLRKEWDDRDFV